MCFSKLNTVYTVLWIVLLIAPIMYITVLSMLSPNVHLFLSVCRLSHWLTLIYKSILAPLHPHLCSQMCGNCSHYGLCSQDIILMQVSRVRTDLAPVIALLLLCAWLYGISPVCVLLQTHLNAAWFELSSGTNYNLHIFIESDSACILQLYLFTCAVLYIVVKNMWMIL